MKNLIFKISIIILLPVICFSQKKPELSPDFFEHFTYKIPSNFNYNDSLQLTDELKKIALEVSKVQDEALSNFSISDTTVLYNFLANTISPNAILGRNDAAVDAILKSRNLKPTPYYSMPYRLVQLAYNKAYVVKNDDGSDNFKDIYYKELLEQLNGLNPEFKNDIVNQQKGYFTKDNHKVVWKSVTQEIQQILDKSNGKLSYEVANSLLFLYHQQYYQLKKYQPIIEKALFAISSSKVMEEKVKIPLRNGLLLGGYVYKDITQTGKVPAIISLSPYPSGGEAVRGNVFATNGYVYVYVDTRGRRESQGELIPYEDDAQDFYDIIDWANKQPWCNGKVATSGGSYLGFAQWQAIRKEFKHPALKAINPMVSVGFGIDFPKSANQFYPYILRWATYVSGREINQPLFDDYHFWDSKYYGLYKNRLPFAKLDSVAGMPNTIFQKWLSHPNFDNYWQNILPKPSDYQDINIPILSITGYYDADQNGALYYYDNHQKYGNKTAKDNHYLLIGPYAHGGAQWQPTPIQNGISIEREAQIPIFKYVIKWFDWTLKGKSKPEFIKGKINYFETGNKVWKSTDSFKKLTTDSLVFFLSPSIISNKKRNQLYALSLNKPQNNNSVVYRHDISMALDSAFLFANPKPFDDSLYMTSPHNMVFESEPLPKDIVLSDKILARLYVSLNVPDADFDILIEEVSSDGKTRNLGEGSIRVRYRNGGEKPQLLKPNEIAQLDFDAIFLNIKKVTKGTKIRLIFQSTNKPSAEKNYGFGGEVSKESTTKSRVIEAKLYMNSKYPSKIVLPYTTK